jgi:pyruvate decarboxylase
MAEHIDLAEYLFRRLHQLGVRGIHGVPGDYNLTALDYVAPAGLEWVGNCNELNAGYAADGYARVKGIGAVVTAFGVGELSAINAIGGAYAEMAPVVHIVGTPPTSIQNSGACMHHSLGDGNFRVFAEMAAKVTVAQANLTSTQTAPSEIDRVLRQCLLQSRPVYIELPTDLVSEKIHASLLSTPISTSIPPNDEGFEDAEVDLIISKIYAAKQPFIIVDGFTSRYGPGVAALANELVRVTGFPCSTTPFGKGIIDETLPNFHGVYAGIAGKQVYMPWAQSCDLVLRLGPLNSDVNTFGFTTIPDPKVTITFHRDSVEVGSAGNGGHYNNLHIKGLLQKILDRLDVSRIPKLDPYPDLGCPRRQLQALEATDPEGVIDQNTFYQRVSTFFREGDIVLSETGTPSVGGRDFVLPKHTQLINSSIWLSIGYMVGATQGAALAQRELIADGGRKGRTILFEGDGSLQMTVQEISTMIRNRLDVTIFVLNNDGYTIERWIHGMEASYNDVAPWRYLEAADFFGAPQDDKEYKISTHRAATWGELERLLADSEVQDGKGFKMIEVIMTREDAPESLKKLVQTVQKRNSGVPGAKVEGDKVTAKAAAQ